MGALAEIADILGPRLSTGESVRALHGRNEAHFPPALPEAVAFPETTAEVAAIMHACAAHGLPITAFGTGSSLEGQHLPIRGGLSLDLSRMDRVLAIHPEDQIAVVQPGLTRTRLNADLRATGLFFPVDPGADASLGGMAATRASGTTTVRYGTMRENVLALEAVMADGAVIRTGSRAQKSSAGYDLTHLLVGSEGTLGIITELTLRLHPQPEAILAATCRFASVAAAVDCVIAVIQSAIPMARIELVDEIMVRGFNLHSGTDLPESPHLFLEFHGSPAAVAEQAAAFREIADGFGVAVWQDATTTEARSALWAMRHNAHHATGALEPGKRTLATDVCVPISKLAEAVVEAQDLARAMGLTSAIVGHVGDGNFHCGVRVDPDDAAGMARALEFSGRLAETALRLGGTVSGEHGIGIGKQKYMAAEHGAALDWMRTLKAAFDPAGLLNPGKMLPPEG
ncbi:FAD-binding protein [Rhodovulum tesquicola]|uniref:FAD-binding oxidoreductase n=1 Tax=Rhodovulum tesquicola TaxID=540254 RepID=UPI002097F2AD|nr:FAD-linked oxidase C-terminal domain-containing protein [Rhodovulum tesquicola]MCO8144566.1 FAD-binding protein [Rhodovulum tesquicola]